ncbi:GNAT family N-acetyltransferase [Streptomyces sp. NPDC053560]|uniref:GNAT family N-acetyltransferase n=1 Tax=Streptomyces sp. NPDC053560 TaxID=3365711 RepID=UPI0037D7D977
MGHVWGEVLDAAAGGAFPAADGSVTVLPPVSERDSGVLSFSGCAFVCADVSPDWVRRRITPGDPAAPLSPGFLAALADRTGRTVEGIDMLMVAEPLPGPPPLALREIRDPAHPRLARALRHRDDVRAWTVGLTGDLTVDLAADLALEGAADGDGHCVVVLGRGVAGRWEVAFEVPEAARGHGLGRRLAVAARHLVPADRPLWAQVAPANAASVRALLAAGFTPVGAEALLAARESGTPNAVDCTTDARRTMDTG